MQVELLSEFLTSYFLGIWESLTNNQDLLLLVLHIDKHNLSLTLFYAIYDTVIMYCYCLNVDSEVLIGSLPLFFSF